MKNPVEYVIDKMDPGVKGPTGLAVLADVTGVNRTTVGRWRHTGVIPAKYFPAILSWGRKHRVGISVNRLVMGGK